MADPKDVGTLDTVPPSIGTQKTVGAADLGTLDTVAPTDSGTLDTLAAIDPSGTLDTVGAGTSPAVRGPATVLGGRMGRYVLLGELGRGGMGVVYSAFDPELDRKVALKVLRPGSSSDAAEAAVRLQREGRAIAKLAHPNVVTVFDVGAEGGNVFVAMELVDGGSLDRWLAAEPRDWREVVDVFLQAGEGLAAAHAAGMIHRDFKPANVLIGTDGRARVTDFGLARSAQGADDAAAPAKQRNSDLALTQTGAMVGTPAYMPPEQFDAAPLDARSDQFSFAVSLYEGLYGERPFKGGSITELYEACSSGIIAGPPARTQVPAWVRAVVLRALAAKPSLRYPTLQVMLGELRRDPAARRRVILGVGGAAVLVAATVGALATRTVSDPCAQAGDQITDVWSAARGQALRQRLIGSGRPYAAAVADNVTSRFDTHGTAWRLARKNACVATRRRGERSEALLDRRMICLDRNLGDLRARVATLEAGDPLAVVDKAIDVTVKLPSVELCADDDALLAAVPPPNDPIVRARTVGLDERLSRASALNDLGRYDEGLSLATTALAEVRTIDHPALLARALCVTADLEARVANFAASERDFVDCATTAARAHDDAVQTSGWIGTLGVVGVYQGLSKEGLRMAAVAEASLLRTGERPDLRAKLLHTHALVLDELGEFDKAYALYDEAYKIWSAPGLAHNDSHALNALNQLGGVRQQQGRYQEAHDLLEQAFRGREALLGREHPLVVDSLQNVAVVETDLGRLEESIALYKDALARGEKALGPEHPSVARILTNMAITLKNMGRDDEALALERRALAVREKAFGPDHAEVATTLHGIAISLSNRGEYDEALLMLARSGAIDAKLYGSESAKVAYNYAAIAGVHYKMGRVEEALAGFQRALAIREKVLGADHPDVAQTLSSIGILEMNLGHLDEAVLHLERSLTIREKRLGPDHAELAYDIGALASVLMKRGKFAEALPLAERALKLRVDGKVQPTSIAESKYYVGQALWGLGRDRTRALSLVREARAAYVAGGPGEVAGVTEVDRWLKTKKP